MKVSLHFLSGIYDCEVIIKDTVGTRNYDVNLVAVAPDSHHVVEIDVENDNFELTVIPKMTDYESAWADMDIQNWKEKLAQKAVYAGNTALNGASQLLFNKNLGAEVKKVISTAKHINLGGTEEFNQAQTKGSIILEVGSCGNTIEEAENAITLFANSYATLLKENLT